MMHTIPDKQSQTGLELLQESIGLVEVLGATTSGNLPLDGRVRDGIVIILDLLAVTLAKAEKALTEPF